MGALALLMCACGGGTPKPAAAELEGDGALSVEPKPGLATVESGAATTLPDAGPPDASAEAQRGQDPPDLGDANPGRRLRVTQVSRETSPLSGQYGVEPCDFNRSYRGTIGKTTLGVVLTRDASDAAKLVGEAHYDRAGPSLSLSGTINERVSFAERGGGSFDGRCETATGKISGSYTLKGKAQPFELWPRPKGWPGMYIETRQKSVLTNYPGCAKVQRPDAVTVAPIPGADFDEAVCAPTGAKARKEALDEGTAACSVGDRGLRVFGIKNAAAVNATLARRSQFASLARSLGKCWRPHSHDTSTWPMNVSAKLLTVQTLSTEYYYSAAHPMNSTSGGVAIDLASGREIGLKEVVTDPDKLRKLVPECGWDYFAVEGTRETGDVGVVVLDDVKQCDGEPLSYLAWDCDPKDPHRTGPAWALFDEGLAILAEGNPHVSAALDGRGPVISWAALARAGVLQQRSRVAHLWAGVTPAAKDAPACTAAYDGNPTLLRWTVTRAR